MKKLCVVLSAFLAAAVIATVWTYYMFGSMVGWFMDSQMQVLAESHTVETIGPPTLRPVTEHHVEKGATIEKVRLLEKSGGKSGLFRRKNS